MELLNEQEIHELKRKAYLLENEMKGFQDMMSQAMDKFLFVFQNQETSLKSYVNKPRTFNTLISFMDDLLDILVAMDSKVNYFIFIYICVCVLHKPLLHRYIMQLLFNTSIN